MDEQGPRGVSVAMGTHNGAAHIAEQLESILSQSLLPSEIVLSDDASSDDTVSIAREVVGSRVPLTVMLNPTALGVTANFEQAISACAGEFVALSDQDDVWLPDRLSTAVSELARRPDLLLLHADARLVDADGKPLGHTLFDALELTQRERDLVHGGRAIEALLRRNLVTGATTVLRRELATRAAPFPTGWVHDEWLAIIAAATGTVDLIEDPLIDYRQHGANQIGASRLSLGGKVRRVLEPRGERNRRLAANFATLESRLEALGTAVAPATLVLAHGKAAHERMRLGLPAARLRRVVPVVRAVARGRYRRFSRGKGDVLRDLVQPAN